MEATIRKICLYWLYVAGIMIIAIVLMTVLNITAFGLDKIARLFDYDVGGLPGYEDLVRLLISCISLMLFPWAQLERGHVSIEFFTDNLSTYTLIVLDRIWLSVTLILVIFLAITMCLGMMESYGDNQLSRILGWTQWPFYIPGIISLILWGVVLFYQILIEKRGHIHA